MTPSPPGHDPEPLEREIDALHLVLDKLIATDDTELLARFIPRVATAGIQAVRARHVIEGRERASWAQVMGIIAELDAETPTDASAGASGVDGDRPG